MRARSLQTGITAPVNTLWHKQLWTCVNREVGLGSHSLSHSSLMSQMVSVNVKHHERRTTRQRSDGLRHVSQTPTSLPLCACACKVLQSGRTRCVRIRLQYCVRIRVQYCAMTLCRESRSASVLRGRHHHTNNDVCNGQRTLKLTVPFSTFYCLV